MSKIKEQFAKELEKQNKFNIEDAEYEMAQEDLDCQRIDYGEEPVDHFEEYLEHRELMNKSLFN